MPDFSSFAEKIGIPFNNLDLLAEAFTHRSYLNEHRDYAGSHNERLEFLGDAVLQLSSADFVFKKFPAKPEGHLSQYRAAMVNAVALAKVAGDIGLNDAILLSKGEAKDKGRARQIILADTFEALLGAMYLDQGYEAVDSFLKRHLYSRGDEFAELYIKRDAKSRFQELAQEKRDITPRYKTLSEEGPDHDKHFTVGVFLDDEEIARGEGVSKREGEQAAAENALLTLKWS